MCFISRPLQLLLDRPMSSSIHFKLSHTKDRDDDGPRGNVDVEDKLDYWDLHGQILMKIWNVTGDAKKQPEYRSSVPVVMS